MAREPNKPKLHAQVSSGIHSVTAFHVGSKKQSASSLSALKIKCRGGDDPPCKRCRDQGLSCGFVPRSNAGPGSEEQFGCSDSWRQSIMDRLQALEDASQGSGAVASARSDPPSVPAYSHILEDDPLTPYHQALEAVLNELPVSQPSEAWSSAFTRPLWTAFLDRVPDLHFLSGRLSITSPTPLLSVAILYVAAVHYPAATHAHHQGIYLDAFTRCLGLALLPTPPFADWTRSSVKISGHGMFDDVLAIILVGLLAVGSVEAVGSWISLAYRILLTGIHEPGPGQEEWRCIWEGLRTIELEHASLTLSSPTLPINLSAIPAASRNGALAPTTATIIGKVLSIMHLRMPRFVGRGLPTIWDEVRVSNLSEQPRPTATAEDVFVMRQWASEIDAWFTEATATTLTATPYSRLIIWLNYHFHRIFVLSIFFPLQGAQGTPPADREVLFQSARLVLQFNATGFEVWSAWDLMLLTHAALTLLQARSVSSALDTDIDLVQAYFESINSSTQPSLRVRLARRLEAALYEARQPIPPTFDAVGTLLGMSGESIPPQGEAGPTLFKILSPSTEFNPSTFDLEFAPESSGEWPTFLTELFGDPNQT